MWTIDDHIQKDENILYTGSPEWIGFFWLFVLALITIFTVIIPIILIVLIYLTKSSTIYAITNKRVIGRSGIISEDFKSSTFKHITSLRVKQGIVGKLFGFGNIIIDTSGSGLGVEFIWRYVNNPVQVKNEIEKHIE
ncbi:MAG: PH domain-containing protein [Candidatus Methanoperedens sp.]|nr:PH domain-containing protein [Candidatus Methanoperedens sp.]